MILWTLSTFLWVLLFIVAGACVLAMAFIVAIAAGLYLRLKFLLK